MRRLEYSRRVRAVPGHARNAAEAMMYLANVARERHRIDQEKRALLKRLRTLDNRLTAIAGEETKLVPMMNTRPITADAAALPVPPPAPAAPPPWARQPAAPPPYTRAAAARGCEVTLQY